MVGRLTKEGSPVSELHLHQRCMFLRGYMWTPWRTLACSYHVNGQEGRKIEALWRGVQSWKAALPKLHKEVTSWGPHTVNVKIVLLPLWWNDYFCSGQGKPHFFQCSGALALRRAGSVHLFLYFYLVMLRWQHQISIVGALTAWKSASTTDKGLFCSLESWISDPYQHTTALGSSLLHLSL